MEWIFKGNKAFHGTDKLWAIAICIVIFLIVGLYQIGTFDWIISKISRVLKGIDHLVDHSVNRDKTNKEKNK